MLKFIYAAILIAIVITSSCKKEKINSSPPIPSSIKLSLISGDKQYAVIGNPLPDSIIVKVTKGNNPVSNYSVQFTGSGCNSDLSTVLQSKSDGTVKYCWRLASEVAPQSLTIIALDGLLKTDSIKATAFASANNGYSENQIGACTPYNSGAANICKLLTGRLIACFNSKTSLRYSDDSGISWHPFAALGSNHDITAITVTPDDEIFAGTFGDGIFYSKDGGGSWLNITPASFNKSEIISDLSFSNKGTLIFTGQKNDLFISPDKGQTWTASSNGLPANFNYMFPCKLNNGDMYVMNFQFSLFKSTDNGANWVIQNDYTTTPVFFIYLDAQGWFYKSIFSNGSNGEGYSTIYLSKDNGQTFSILYSVRDFVNAISILSDGNLYYSNYFSINKFYNSNGVAPIIPNTDPLIVRFMQISNGKYIYAYKNLLHYQ